MRLTKKEADEYVAEMGRRITCKGPFKVEKMRAIVRRAKRERGENLEADVATVLLDLAEMENGPGLERAARAFLIYLSNSGRREDYLRFSKEMRSHCGQNREELLLSNPYDGEEYDYECRCGLKGTYRAPLIEVVEGQA